jgi:hypothetical protein
MPKIIRNVAKVDWGFFSETETRVHLQAIGPAPRYKVWLERNGQRCCVDSEQHVDIPPKVMRPLQLAVAQNRFQIESMWVNMKIDLGQFVMTVDPNRALATVTLYPGEHTQRKITHQIPPGYARPAYLEHYRLDSEIATLQLGTLLDEARRYDIYLPDLIWGKISGRVDTDW